MAPKPTSPATPTRSRKAEHLDINLHRNVDAKGVTNGLERYAFEHCALPDLDLAGVDTGAAVLGWQLRAPLFISCMTGGVDEAARINAILAAAAEHEGLALGLGSARVLLEDPGAVGFSVRRQAPTIPVLANLGAVQLRRGVGVDDCCRIVELLGASALVLHLNPLQEALQVEGDTTFAGLLPRIAAVAARLPVPVIVKEVGWGLSPDVVHGLLDAGVAAVDVAGAGGTSWSEVERHRLGDHPRSQVAAAFAGWGIPTAEALRRARAAAPAATILASGGIRGGTDLALAVALGADMVGAAGPFLRAAGAGEEAVVALLREWTEVLRITMFCVGAPDLRALRSSPRLLHDGRPVRGSLGAGPAAALAGTPGVADPHPPGATGGNGRHREHGDGDPGRTEPGRVSVLRAPLATAARAGSNGGSPPAPATGWRPPSAGAAATPEAFSGATPAAPAAAPPTPLPSAVDLAAADAYCLALARRHDENFTVATRLLATRTRIHLARVYAFCRITDDLGDEGEGDATPRLLAWRAAAESALCGGVRAGHPVLLALAETVAARQLDVRPFLDLVDANLQDQRVSEYASWPELEAYCRLSAAPVGRIVLGVVGVREAAAVALADDVCIGLQLANFAQDVGVDRAKGRTYLLQDELRAAGETGAIRLMCDRAERLLRSGERLERMVGGRTRLQLSLYRRGGLAIVAAVRRGGYRTAEVRPRVDARTKLRLAATALPALAARPPVAGGDGGRLCAAVARREATNFYWGFVALPGDQRRAVYALYAFARQVDDAADASADPGAAVAAQRERLRRTLDGRPDDAVTAALLDAVRRHAVPDAEIEALIDGVERDLTTARYASWEELSGYCRLVASTIGRMCVRVFGFTETAALLRADELGIAMQLTNILRDVREDAAMGRIYLPADERARFGVDDDAILAGVEVPGWAPLVHLEAERARRLFASGLEVTRHIPRRSGMCVQTMAGIYRRLLEDIDRDPAAPLRGRLALPMRRKLAVLAGAWR